MRGLRNCFSVAPGVGINRSAWQAILLQFNHRCAYCLRGDKKLTQDHMIPTSKGGEDIPENVVPACGACNSRKGDRSLLTMLRPPRPQKTAAKARARAYMKQVRANTPCVRCGVLKPVDFHNHEHVQDDSRRIAHMAARGASIPALQAEIAKCTPLCRRCHMREDGRMLRLAESHPLKKGMLLVGPSPCTRCGIPAKPLRKGLCNRCNHRARGAARADMLTKTPAQSEVVPLQPQPGQPTRRCGGDDARTKPLIA